jgi:hypothetical protein
MQATEELCHQMKDLNIEFDDIITTIGTQKSETRTSYISHQWCVS